MTAPALLTQQQPGGSLRAGPWWWPRRMSILDRVMFSHGLMTMIIILVLMLSVVIGIDLLLNLNRLLRGGLEDDQLRSLLIVRFVLYQIPGVMSLLIPVVFIVALIATTAPMLRRGEYIALSASGISLPRSARGLFILALLVGMADFLIADRVAPHLETRRDTVEEQLTGSSRGAQTWIIADTGSRWMAADVTLSDPLEPRLHGIMIAPADGSIVHATALDWQAGRWQLRGPVVIGHHNSYQELDSLPCDGPLRLPLTPSGLGELLASSHTMTCRELLAHGGTSQRAVAWGRLLRIFAPLLAALYTLPAFVRFLHRYHMVQAAVRAVVIGLIPLGIITGAAWSADTGALRPETISIMALALAAIPGLAMVWRWRL